MMTPATLHASCKKLSGVAAEGDLLIEVNTTDGQVRDPVGNVVFSGPTVVKLVAGEATITLPASNDATLSPTGFTYTVTEVLKHVSKGDYRSATFTVASGSSVHLADMASDEEVAEDPSYGASLNGVQGEVDAIRDLSDDVFATALSASIAQALEDAENLSEILAEAADIAVAAELDEIGVDAAGVGIVAKRGRWPVMNIVTDGGAPIVNREDYVNGDYTITDTDTGVVQGGGLKIRGRGNSTWGAPKKPYRLNLDTATALLGMTAVQKNWALLANHYDSSKINNALALTLGQALSGLEWTPLYRHVEVVLNGDYLGIYQLADLVRMETGRLAKTAATGTTGLPLTGAYLMEIDGRYIENGDPGFTTSHGVPIAYDTPDGANGTQAAYIADWIQDFEDALYAGSDVSTLIDFDSFVDWYLVNEMLANTDSAFFSSCKLWKERDTGTPGRLYMGPLWDFDLSIGEGMQSSSSLFKLLTRQAPWFNRLFRRSAFRDLIADRWPDVVTALGDYEAFIDQGIDALEPAISRNDTRWEETTYSAQEADARKVWLRNRIDWLGPRLTTYSTFDSTFAATF